MKNHESYLHMSFKPLQTLFLLVAISMYLNATPKLLERTILPADTFERGSSSGQFLEQRTPFYNKQPIQGFSSILKAKNGKLWALSDNGFGSKKNSADYLLKIYLITPNYETSKITVNSTLTLHDPDKHIPFKIVADEKFYPESNISVPKLIQNQRLLTGADFDVESFQQLSNGTFYIGDEFGPFLLHLDNTGKLLRSPISLPNVVSPDHPTHSKNSNLPRSRGFEGMSISPDQEFLYPMLEGSLNGQKHLNIYQFNTTTNLYTNAHYKYLLDSPEHAIGEFTLISETVGYIIERDNKQGDEAKFKKVFQIDLTKTDKEGFLVKKELIDLLNIADPNNIGGEDTQNGIFRFPFVTIEGIVQIKPNLIAIVNDNNYPFSVGRHTKTGQPDDTELILIQLAKE